MKVLLRSELKLYWPTNINGQCSTKFLRLVAFETKKWFWLRLMLNPCNMNWHVTDNRVIDFDLQRVQTRRIFHRYKWQ